MRRIHPSSTKSEVKKALRKLALQYHPNVCRENNIIQFHRINEAYDMVMSQLREESTKEEMSTYEQSDVGTEEAVVGMDAPDCELWEPGRSGWDGKEQES